MFPMKVIVVGMLLQSWISPASGSACTGSSDDETTLLQVKQDIQHGVSRSEGEKATNPVQVRMEPPQVVFELPSMPVENGGMPPAEKVLEGGVPAGAALNAAGYPVASGVQVGLVGGMIAPLGGASLLAPLGAYTGAPVRATAAQAAQIGAERMVQQSASTITQAANVAENSAVAAQSYGHYPSPYYGGGGGYYPQVMPAYPMGGAMPFQSVPPMMGGYQQSLYPTVQQQVYSSFPTYPYQQAVSGYGSAYGSAYGSPYGSAYGSPYQGAYGSAYGSPYQGGYGSAFTPSYLSSASMTQA